MQTVTEGTNVSLTVSLAGALNPTEVRFTVYDEDENIALVEQIVAVPAPLPASMTITVPDTANLLPTDSEGGYRRVDISVVIQAGTVNSRQQYLIAPSKRLIPFVNSFQTYEKAMIETVSMPNLFGFANATEDEQKRALIEAYRRLTRLGYRVRSPRDEDFDRMTMVAFDLDGDEFISPRTWRLIDQAWWDARYNDAFKAAMYRAQVIEANEILRLDVPNEKRRAGLMSETIGESSMMFRPGKAIDFGLSRATMDCISGYLSVRLTITRT